MPQDLSSIVAGPIERLATGFQFTEGPLWHPDGFWLFVDTRANMIHRLVPGGSPEAFRSESRRTNGLTFDLDRRVLMCEGHGRQVSRREHDGAITTLVERWDGKRLNRPNDLVVHSRGAVYFTDPQGLVEEADREIGFSPVFRIDVDGSVAPAISDLSYPNGLAFSPDESVLYVANSREPKALYAFDVDAGGGLSGGRMLVDMSDAPGDGVPDGLKIDTDGHIYCTGPGGLWIIEPGGSVMGVVEFPEQPSNCAFGGPGYDTLLVTARSSVYSVRLATRGIAPPGARA